MNASTTGTSPSVSGSPVQWCQPVNRRMRLDDLDTLGISSQTIAEQLLAHHQWAAAADVAEYFLDEMTRINDALYTWLIAILDFRLERVGAPGLDEPRRIIDAMRTFSPAAGDLAAILNACHSQDAQAAHQRLELMRVRIAALHDQLVWWIQHLLTDLAEQAGEDAVRDVVVRTYEDLWKVRYQPWSRMTPLQRLQLSVEGMRGHLSGPRHRGDVTILDEGDRYTMILDPCGSCGVLRHGDPDSGRPPSDPAGTQQPHPWAWNRVGVSWYAVHSPIVMEWLQMSQGDPPMRPHQDCDSNQPCHWYIYKNPADTRPNHYAQMGFAPPRACLP